MRMLAYNNFFVLCFLNKVVVLYIFGNMDFITCSVVKDTSQNVADIDTGYKVSPTPLSILN